MARHAEDKKGVDVTEEDREKARGRRKGLIDPSYDEVDAALKAVKLCGACLTGEPKKKNVEGKCLMCAGVGLVRDHDQRKWAAELVINRADPAPKAIEAKIDDSRNNNALLEKYDTPEKAASALAALRQAEKIALTVASE